MAESDHSRPWTRHEAVSRHQVAQGQDRSFCDADSRRNHDSAPAVSVIANPKAPLWRGQVAAIIARSGDSEGLAEAARPAGQLGPVFGAAQRDPASAGHSFHTGERLESAKEDASRLTLGLARNIQTVMISIDEIDVGVPGRPKQDGIAQRLT